MNLFLRKLSNVMKQFIPVIEQKQITLFFSKSETIFFIAMDRGLIKRVVENLFNNVRA